MKKVRLFGLVSAILMVIATFLPWFGFSSSMSMSVSGIPGMESLGGGLSGSYGGSISTSGINFWGGSVGILVAIIGAILIYKNSILSVGAGILNLFIGGGYLFEWFIPGAGSFNANVDLGGYGNVSTSMNPQFGLYIFSVCSLLFLILSIANSASRTPENIALNIQTNELIDQAAQYLKQPTQMVSHQDTQACSNCKSQYPMNAKFCPNCGTPASKSKFCSECGSEVEASAKFCPNCGKTIVSFSHPKSANIIEDDL